VWPAVVVFSLSVYYESKNFQLFNVLRVSDWEMQKALLSFA